MEKVKKGKNTKVDEWQIASGNEKNASMKCLFTYKSNRCLRNEGISSGGEGMM